MKTLTVILIFSALSAHAADKDLSFQQVPKNINVGYRTNPKIIYVNELFIAVSDIQFTRAKGERKIRFSIDDSSWRDSYSPWVELSKEEIIPQGIMARMEKHERLEEVQILFLLNRHLLPNMGEELKVGADTFESFRTQFIPIKPFGEFSSPQKLLAFVVKAILEKDETVISVAYGNGNTGATGSFSGFKSVAKELAKFSGKSLSFSPPVSKNVRETWREYALGVSSDVGFCSREEDLTSELSLDQKVVLRANVNCYSSKSSADVIRCGSKTPYANQTCLLQIQ